MESNELDNDPEQLLSVCKDTKKQFDTAVEYCERRKEELKDLKKNIETKKEELEELEKERWSVVNDIDRMDQEIGRLQTKLTKLYAAKLEKVIDVT